METALGEKLVVCPYDKRHVMPERRFLWHLSMNCKAHQEKKDEFMLCPYNSLHRVEKTLFEAHLQTCENKNDYRCEREAREFLNLNDKLMEMEIAKEWEEEEKVEEKSSADWWQFWELEQKKIEKGNGGKWCDMKENELWSVE